MSSCLTCVSDHVAAVLDLATIGAYDRLDALRPAPAGLERVPPDMAAGTDQVLKPVANAKPSRLWWVYEATMAALALIAVWLLTVPDRGRARVANLVIWGNPRSCDRVKYYESS